METKPIDILLVEDNEGDIELTKLAFKEGKLLHRLSVAHHGVEALDYLFKRGGFESAFTPDLILLDLNMPKMDGKEVLDVIKKDDALQMIPVIVLTSSKAQLDILESYKRHANCYIIKPLTLEKFMDVARQVEYFWINLVQLPREAMH